MASKTSIAKAESDVFPVRVQTPQKLVWEGVAKAVSSESSKGPFDILPDHADMVTIIEKKPIQVVTPEKEETFMFEKAVVAVTGGKVVIFADIESDAYIVTNIDKPSKT